MRWALCWGLVAGLPQPSSHRVVEVSVRGESTTSCVTADAIVLGIERTLEIDVERPSADEPAEASIEVELRAQRVVLRVSGPDGAARERILDTEQPDCEPLRAAVVLVAALMLDELWAGDAPMHVQPVPAPTPTPTPTQPPPAAAVASTASTRVAPSWASYTGLSGLFAVGDLAGVSGGVGLSFEVEAPRVMAVRIDAWAWPRRRALEGGRGARFSAYDAKVAICPSPLRRPKVGLGLCAGLRAGAVHAVGLGLDEGEAAVVPRVQIDAELGARFHLGGPAWLRLFAGASFPLLRYAFSFDAAPGERVLVHRTAPVVPLAGLGIELRGTLTSPFSHGGTARPSLRRGKAPPEPPTLRR